MKLLRTAELLVTLVTLLAANSILATEEQKNETVTVTGEVLDMACYLDHGAHGEKHAQCAKTCIESGLPVGIKTAEGKSYIVIGEHKPLNKELAAYAAKTVTLKGKLVSRDGINMLVNAELVK